MIRFETILTMLALQERAGQPLHHMDNADTLEGVSLRTLRANNAVYTTLETWYYSDGEADAQPAEWPVDYLSAGITIPAGEVWAIRNGDLMARHTVKKYNELAAKGKLEAIWQSCTVMMEGENWRP